MDKECRDKVLSMVAQLFHEDGVILRFYWDPDMNNGCGGEYLQWGRWC